MVTPPSAPMSIGRATKLATRPSLVCTQAFGPTSTGWSFTRLDHWSLGSARQPAEVLDTREVLVELDALAVEQQLLLLGVIREVAVRRALLQVLQPLDLALGPLGVGREVRAAAETTQGKG